MARNLTEQKPRPALGRGGSDAAQNPRRLALRLGVPVFVLRLAGAARSKAGVWRERLAHRCD